MIALMIQKNLLGNEVCPQRSVANAKTQRLLSR